MSCEIIYTKGRCYPQQTNIPPLYNRRILTKWLLYVVHIVTYIIKLDSHSLECGKAQPPIYTTYIHMCNVGMCHKQALTMNSTLIRGQHTGPLPA